MLIKKMKTAWPCVNGNDIVHLDLRPTGHAENKRGAILEQAMNVTLRTDQLHCGDRHLRMKALIRCAGQFYWNYIFRANPESRRSAGTRAPSLRVGYSGTGG